MITPVCSENHVTHERERERERERQVINHNNEGGVRERDMRERET